MESLVRDQLMNHLTSGGQLSDNQHGFRARQSCMTQLLEVLEDWTQMIEDGDPVDALYLDFRKAFDSVPHERLLAKLGSFGACIDLREWKISLLIVLKVVNISTTACRASDCFTAPATKLREGPSTMVPLTQNSAVIVLT